MTLPLQASQQRVEETLARLRSNAAQEAFNNMNEKSVKQILSEKSTPSLENAQEGIKMARKPKMRIVKHYLCDSCDAIINKPEEGYVIKGNIYVADPAEKGGLIGNNFPKAEEDDQIKLSDVKETVMCKKCFVQAIQLYDKPRQTKKPLIVPNKNDDFLYSGQSSVREQAAAILRSASPGQARLNEMYSRVRAERDTPAQPGPVDDVPF